MKRKAFTLIELLVVIAIIAILAAILFPVFAQAKKAAKKAASAQNNRQVALASIMYGGDYDDTIPVFINGPYQALQNLHDGQIHSSGFERTDGWPLLTMPYIKSRGLFVDPGRGDINSIWAGPTLRSGDAGYVATANTYRNQSRFPMYGVNYLFVSPLHIPSSKMTDPTPTNWMVGESHTFTEADDPAGTIFYTESQRGYGATTSTDNLGVLDATRGFFGVDAPGLWGVLAASSIQYVIFWAGTYCSGDFCGDADSATQGRQKRTNFVYIGYNDGANATFLDGHVKYMKDNQLASGTNYLSSTPQDGGTGYFGGGATITDKTHYLWNLTDNYYGA
jgi:prepilin-type N-terminal cleavage/methylation domain-containing protein/prepilin-type processing-associated H-X9-DG protein